MQCLLLLQLITLFFYYVVLHIKFKQIKQIPKAYNVFFKYSRLDNNNSSEYLIGKTLF